MSRENKQREIMSTLKAGFTKKLAETIQDTINTDLKKEDSNRESLNKRKLAGKHRRVATQGRVSPSKEEPTSSMGLISPKPTAAKRSPRANTATGPKARFFGILGLDAIQEEDGKLGGYKTVVSSQPNKGGKVVLKREYTYGLDERLYTSEYDRERNKRKFGDLMKKVDAEVKVNDAYLTEIKVAKKLRASGLSSLFRRKHEESESTLDTEIEAIIRKQDKRRHDENYQQQLEHFNLPDNEETQRLLKTLGKLQVKSAAAGVKVTRLTHLNEIGHRQVQAIKANDGDQLSGAQSHRQSRIEEPLEPVHHRTKSEAKAKPLKSESHEGGKLKPHTFLTQPICMEHFKPLDLLAFALVNRQLQLFLVKQTVSKLVFELAASVRTEQMAVCMSIETHKVTERVLICMGFQCNP
jgi:hypothetical protein